MELIVQRSTTVRLIIFTVKYSLIDTFIVTWNPPVVPSLFSQLSMGPDAENVAIYGPNADVLEYNKVFQLTVINWDAGKHPL